MFIAIIDDDPLFQFILKKMITRGRDGLRTEEFGNGKEAIDFITMMKADPLTLPHTILLDINMPKMNGWQFLDALRNLEQPDYRPNIYLISSSVDSVDALRASTYSELRDFLIKPLSQKQIDEIVHRHTC